MTNVLYNPGDTIAKYGPFVKCLLMQHKKSFCSHCFIAKIGLKTCSNCQHTKYCNELCQKLDWRNGHKIECKVWQCAFFCELSFKDSFWMLLLRLHALLRLKPRLAEKKINLNCGPARCFNDLKPQPRQTSNDPTIIMEMHRTVSICYFMAKYLNKLNPGSANPNEIFRQACILRNNYRKIYNDEDQRWIGICVYIDPDHKQHSCAPNAIILRRSIYCFIRAIATIPQGHRPTLSYFLDVLSKEERQKDLSLIHDIACSCNVCNSEVDLVVDYLRLRKLIKSSIELGKRADLTGVSWSDVMCEHNEAINGLHLIYHKYDTLITNQFARTLITGIRLNVSRHELFILAVETNKRMIITYGDDHSEYRLFFNIAFNNFKEDYISLSVGVLQSIMHVF